MGRGGKRLPRELPQKAGHSEIERAPYFLYHTAHHATFADHGCSHVDLAEKRLVKIAVPFNVTIPSQRIS